MAEEGNALPPPSGEPSPEPDSVSGGDLPPPGGLGSGPPPINNDGGDDPAEPQPDDEPREQRGMSKQSAGGRAGSKQSAGRTSSKASSATPPTRVSTFQKYVDKASMTRLHVLQFTSQKEWWYEGQNALGFTLILWLVFIYIMYTRGGVEQSYETGSSVLQHMENIVAHPYLSGIRTRSTDEDPLPCRCACQSSSAGMPKGPCDPKASEYQDYLGRLPAGAPRLRHLSNIALQSAGINPADLGDKLGAGNMDINPMSWDKIHEPEDVWFWIEHGFIPDIWQNRTRSAKSMGLQGLIAQKNLIIGGVRIRQKRAQWSTDCEKKVNPGLTNFYRPECRGVDPATGPFGPTNETQVKGNAWYAFGPSTVAKEPGSYDLLLDTEFDVGQALDSAGKCRRFNWIDATTESVGIQAVTLNAEIGMFAIININFDFPSGGGVVKKVRVNTIWALGSKLEFVDIMPELIFMGMIGLLLRQELMQMLCACRSIRKCLDYWLDLWCVVDWVSMIVAVLIAIFFLWQIQNIGAISEAVAALPRAPFEDGGYWLDIDFYQSQWQAILDSAIDVYERKGFYQLCLFSYTGILTARFLKGFLAQAKLAMLQLTIGNVSWDLYHLFIFFAMLFLNFQTGGHILFGPELEEWSSLSSAGSTSVQVMLGNYPFSPMFEMAPFSAVCWFWSFLISVVFVLLNLIFAMISDYFGTIRKIVGATDPIWTDSWNAIVDLGWRFWWRKVNLEDMELKAAFIDNPYNEVVPGLMEASQVPWSLERDAHHSCLGVRLGRHHLDAMTVEGWNANPDHPDYNAGYVECTSKGIQELGPDIMAADHLIELAEPYLAREEKGHKDSLLAVMRKFVLLLRKHHADMDEHCGELEGEVTQDHSALARTLDYLEANIRQVLQDFERLKEEGVHSLAPPMHALPKPGTLASLEAQNQSMVAPGALLRAIDVHTAGIERKNGPVPVKQPEPPEQPVVEAAMLMNSDMCNTAFNSVGNQLQLEDGDNRPGKVTGEKLVRKRGEEQQKKLALENERAQAANNSSNMLALPPVAPSAPSAPPMAALSNQPAAEPIGNNNPGAMLALDDLLAIADNQPSN